MIASLRGTVENIRGSNITLEVHGVGYDVIGSRALIEQLEIGSSAGIVVHTDVKEDSIRLFGFAHDLEKQIFLLLLKVSSVGAKTSLDIISGLECRVLLRAIGEGDTGKLQSIKGVGKKTAERIVLELRDKVAESAVDLQESGSSGRSVHGAFQDAIDALQALGFSRADAETAVRAVQDHGTMAAELDPGLIVKEALRFV